MKIFYSAKNNAFYVEVLKNEYELAESWPADAEEIDSDIYTRLMEGQQAGQSIVTGEDGQPILADAPGLTPEQLISRAASRKASLMSQANGAISPLQDAVDLGMASEQEVTLLQAWKTYRVLLNRIDVSTAPDIDWPEQPE